MTGPGPDGPERTPHTQVPRPESGRGTLRRVTRLAAGGRMADYSARRSRRSSLGSEKVSVSSAVVTGLTDPKP
ncbi:hypothetical protein GCM10028793_01610 [Nocardiopsis oceani]